MVTGLIRTSTPPGRDEVQALVEIDAALRQTLLDTAARMISLQRVCSRHRYHTHYGTMHDRLLLRTSYCKCPQLTGKALSF